MKRLPVLFYILYAAALSYLAIRILPYVLRELAR